MYILLFDLPLIYSSSFHLKSPKQPTSLLDSTPVTKILCVCFFQMAYVHDINRSKYFFIPFLIDVLTFELHPFFSTTPTVIFSRHFHPNHPQTCRLIMSLRLLNVESPTDSNANAISPSDEDDFQLTTVISAFHSQSHEQVERLQFPGPDSKSDHRFKSHPGAHHSPSPC